MAGLTHDNAEEGLAARFAAQVAFCLAIVSALRLGCASALWRLASFISGVLFFPVFETLILALTSSVRGTPRVFSAAFKDASGGGFIPKIFSSLLCRLRDLSDHFAPFRDLVSGQILYPLGIKVFNLSTQNCSRVSLKGTSELLISSIISKVQTSGPYRSQAACNKGLSWHPLRSIEKCSWRLRSFWIDDPTNCFLVISFVKVYTICIRAPIEIKVC
jgi:hypothetical protein